MRPRVLPLTCAREVHGAVKQGRTLPPLPCGSSDGRWNTLRSSYALRNPTGLNCRKLSGFYGILELCEATHRHGLDASVRNQVSVHRYLPLASALL